MQQMCASEVQVFAQILDGYMSYWAQKSILWGPSDYNIVHLGETRVVQLQEAINCKAAVQVDTYEKGPGQRELQQDKHL